MVMFGGIPLVVWLAYLSVVPIFMFATLEINATGVFSGEDLLEENRSLFLNQ